ncbi:tetratricopeptide repeat protein [Kiloniella antarctica]|uniref:Tetratricopeptide repeat protein n=1 Tax=Kiloniella antarctica TaxID=1550907 RepID=A0ABW5BNS6_9PROT
MTLVYIKRMILLMGIAFMLSGCSYINDFSNVVGASIKVDSVAQGSTSIETEELDEETAQIYKIAEETYRRGDVRTAIGLYQRAFELSPHNPQPMLRVGEILSDHGEPLAAGQAYRQVLVVDPLNVEAKRGLGITFMKRGQTDLAIEQFADGLAIEKNTKLLNVMGVAYDQKGERQTAQRYYLEGLELDQNNLSLRSNYGLSMAYQGRHNEAIAMLYPLSKEPAATVRHRQLLAMAYSLAGDFDAAEQTTRIDMDDVDVAKRMRYFHSLQSAEPSYAEKIDIIEIESLPQ